jgi:H+-translocating NAD(P) transhydrogenase subunit beta
VPLAALSPTSDFVTVCYIAAFSLFILGIRRGTHPTTARQGNLIAAVGMAIAIAITLALDPIGNWGLIALGIGVGTLVGAVASKRVQMTQMPQMVALYNGVGGGAAALIAWSEFRDHIQAGASIPLDIIVFMLFSLVVGSVSFWGSNVAFAKLQELISGRPIRFPGQHIFNGLLLAAILAGCIVLGANHDSDPSQALFVAILVGAAFLGVLFVLPIGGADMPVVISLLNAFTGLAAASAGFALDNVALIVAGTLVGSSGTILTLEMSRASPRGRRGRARSARTPPSGRRTRPSSWPTRTPSSSCRATGWRSRRRSTPSRSSPTSSRSAASTSTTRSTRSPGGCRGT